MRKQHDIWNQGKVEELVGGIRELGDEEKEGLLDLLIEKGF
jgi:hypothetical protein